MDCRTGEQTVREMDADEVAARWADEAMARQEIAMIVDRDARLMALRDKARRRALTTADVLAAITLLIESL